MKYIIRKTIHGKWNYWLDKDNLWNGLEDNAFKFSDRDCAERLRNQFIKKDCQSIIEIYPSKC
jgi:hypothetical protein